MIGTNAIVLSKQQLCKVPNLDQNQVYREREGQTLPLNGFSPDLGGNKLLKQGPGPNEVPPEGLLCLQQLQAHLLSAVALHKSGPSSAVWLGSGWLKHERR